MSATKNVFDDFFGASPCISPVSSKQNLALFFEEAIQEEQFQGASADSSKDFRSSDGSEAGGFKGDGTNQALKDSSAPMLRSTKNRGSIGLKAVRPVSKNTLEMNALKNRLASLVMQDSSDDENCEEFDKYIQANWSPEK
ncbi:hypothetical protein GUITHDRAFT_153840 [Guillardia theta CCMP2712]|uniref:Uncharacterized protein n=1 Tax=Guillardia theta (strain CCMP2712) TaxID=905079 RepID=L1IYJ5_GUITC|nr:hypothetical protein GUITHDRAFT_153840 [Guillardia theta CCMP2712]EKX41333.1 hypothetical protein GUITHDRAFT_153840 [Guillardia theta CCMP2712]|mmetsp:Transcript_1433/g.4334  ORF Transcript_1433/g.4334 Transcript_1433/m.4334 type:complete len:140 (-) Transcript_1433:73-492(-)|eukprot:XP_005828313.1 hypothetical protein GUITHDRAFT_153840 [Guillardia theta CCMP2712]